MYFQNPTKLSSATWACVPQKTLNTSLPTQSFHQKSLSNSRRLKTFKTTLTRSAEWSIRWRERRPHLKYSWRPCNRSWLMPLNKCRPTRTTKRLVIWPTSSFRMLRIVLNYCPNKGLLYRHSSTLTSTKRRDPMPCLTNRQWPLNLRRRAILRKY